MSDDLRQRHGDLVWRVRFRGDRWLYLVLLLEFQAAVDRAMAVRMLGYTALLYQKLIADGALREHGVLPPVLPIVVYNGRRPWTAASDVSELIASGGPVLARYQPSQRYFLLDGGRWENAALPRGNLVSALIALEKNRDPERVPALLKTLRGLLRKQKDDELGRAFRAWVAQVMPRRLRDAAPESLPQLEEVETMLSENVREWTAGWVAEGREQGLEQGLEQGRAEERALLCRQAARKFDDDAARRLADVLAEVADPERLAQVGDWIIECGTAADLFARVAETRRPGN